MFETEKELKSMQNLTNGSISLTAMLTLFFPPFGYSYTGRYAAAFITLIILCILIFLDFNLYLCFAMLAAVENSNSVSKARGLTQQKEQKVSQPASNNQTSHSDPNVQILRLAKKHGEVTLADLVIETGMPPKKVRQVVLELERQALMCSSNREHDGAVVYRII